MKHYKFFKSPAIIVAIRSFGNKEIKGIAKCSPNDTFDEDIGRKLAILRCDKKLAKAKLKEAELNLKKADKMITHYIKVYSEANSYFAKCKNNYNSVSKALEEFETKLR